MLRRATQKVGGFTASVIITGITSLLTIPIIVVFAGAQSWASIAVGQTIGVVATVFIGLGWAQLGPTVIARATRIERARYYRESVAARTIAYLLTLPLIVLTASALAPAADASSLTVLGALVSAFLATSTPWYFVGTGDPRGLFLYDAAPRALGTWGGALATIPTGSGIAAVVGIAAGNVAATVFSFAVIKRREGPATRFTLKELFHAVRGQQAGIGIGVFSTIYQSLPLLIVSAAFPSSTAAYALVDRLRQQAVTSVTPIAQSAQGWVPQAVGAELHRRVRIVRNIALCLGALGAIAFATLAMPVGSALGGGVIRIGPDLAVPIGTTFGLSISTLIIGSACLIPLGCAGAVARSAIVGTCAIVIALAVGAVAPSPGAVAIATAIAQFSVLTVQLWSLHRALHTPAACPETEPDK